MSQAATPVLRRVLLAFDGRPPSRRALDLAVELARAVGAEAGVVSVVPERLGLPADDPWSETSEHASELFEARQRFEEAGVAVQTHEPTGDAGPQIVAVTRDFGYDTIVVGSRHMDPIRERLLGSVSDYVAHHAQANVIIAR